MKIWTNNRFEGMWPVPVAAVVIAKNKEDACKYLNAELKKQGLPGDAEVEDMKRLHKKEGHLIILSDGNY